MKSILYIGFAIAGLTAFTAYAQERSAGQAYDAQVNWGTLQNQFDQVNSQNKILAAIITKMQTCSIQRKLYSPSDESADANGCVKSGGTTLKTGTIRETGKAVTTKTVVFDEPFDEVPRVELGLQGFYFTGPCRDDTINFSLQATEVTKTGFKVQMGGKIGGCGGHLIQGVVWIATTEQASTVVLPPPPAPNSNSNPLQDLLNLLNNTKPKPNPVTPGGSR